MSSSHHEYVVSNLPLGVRFYQSDVTTSGYVPFHWHNSIEVLLVLNGELTVTMNRKPPVLPIMSLLSFHQGSFMMSEIRPIKPWFCRYRFRFLIHTLPSQKRSYLI